MLGAVLALVMIASLVFTHGGACAAVIMSESDWHAVHATVTAPKVSPDTGCRHHDLPPGHRHGTEQDCSATDPPGVQLPAAVQAVFAAVAGRSGCRPHPARPGAVPLRAPDPVHICVMRI
ncbi:hypothetical protein Sme01_57240 [Sphaerisporangium melleum]|uniref:Secreted protein n=1 Tax=Sphaerisporangium melleum TaxID=321316 RepID=A0A917R7N1_9ACTN|nr:hypothetical protein [Sphaerisporangium melleum]GGK94473.1 hypothetical protein GCM10007964_41120 [Sphaerisporangium melleum]GII73248.1 hypothetical protein Sme01_57240 [Sphaerisporangium melleum]